MIERIVIVGAGQAAAQAVETLWHSGYRNSIIVIGDEPHLPYRRPPLSKKYLAGAAGDDRLLIHRPDYYTERSVEMRLGRRVMDIQTREQRVRLDDESTIAYDALLLSTGSRAQRLAIPGADLDGIYYVRTLADVDALRTACIPGRRLVVVGAGYVGMEVAATCSQMGLGVTVLEVAERVMKRAVCAEVSSFYEAEHAARGIAIRCNTRVRAFAGYECSRRVRSVLCADGTEYPADLVVVGIGISPADEVARAAGLRCSDGITVDRHCQTSDLAVFAAGDCTNQPNACTGEPMRLESVDNAVEQAATAARNLLGERVAHEKVPWFWSDQFDLKLVIVGRSAGHDAVIVRGSAAARSFSVCYLRAGELIAIDTI
ncbi:MAG: NAD(P)/FAD-dependent oxidoreductase, partial [Steroidobacteraceae bacterium]